MQIVVYLIDCECLKLLFSIKNWIYVIYFRFIIVDYFLDKIDRVFYLDVDIVCKGSIQEFIDFNFIENEIVVVVVEGELEWWIKCLVSLVMSGLVFGYFNVGFILINIFFWIVENIFKKVIEMLKDLEVVQCIMYFDQDVLNILLVNKVCFVDKKFNI